MHEDGAVGVAGAVGVGVAGSTLAQLTFAGHLESNRRGGVGKTTVTMMLAYGLSGARRQKVLLVDLDAQASSSIIMMGHQRWLAARETHRTASGVGRKNFIEDIMRLADKRDGGLQAPAWR
jgi:AAA domain